MDGFRNADPSKGAPIEPVERYIFIVSRPAGAPTDLESLVGALEALGVKVDLEYGAIPIDQHRLRFALRGTAHADAVEEAREDPSIEVFADPRLENM